MIETDNSQKLRAGLIKEIATNWKLEAKSEDVGRYFYHMTGNNNSDNLFVGVSTCKLRV